MPRRVSGKRVVRVTLHKYRKAACQHFGDRAVGERDLAGLADVVWLVISIENINAWAAQRGLSPVLWDARSARFWAVLGELHEHPGSYSHRPLYGIA